MAYEPEIDEAYVISLLKKDAERKRLGGPSSPSSRDRRPDSKPKPNTTFLNRALQDVEFHNKTLKAKEEAEAEARRRRRAPKSRPAQQLYSVRSRFERDEPANKRRKTSEYERRESKRHGDDDEEPSSRLSHRHERSKSARHQDRRKEDSGSDTEPSRKKRSGTERSRHRSRRRSRSPDDRSRETARSPAPPIRSRSKQRRSLSQESDPLEAMIGPLPAGKSPKQTTMDRRFAPDYDPDDDVDSEEGSDSSAAAIRNSKRWKTGRAEQLRRAGFSEDQVQKAVSGPSKVSGVPDPDQLRWSRKGEDREWDRGKELDESGAVKVARPFSTT